ncbi:hypothetical protein [Kaistia nematophila]|uniref:Yip1 domain-containing protein n=1 Tax=Kaistia nematophila TaxID=2994654 RepID=A0A9X3IJ17_9HYPH|nr:hypothetical protein [Kaistia nematophila]MCX5567963.1 hypothetical protein [Kaistia nematophila]
MISPSSSSALTGAFELFLGRREGLQRFDFSVEGFWRSFGAIFFMLPFFAISVAVEHRLRPEDVTVAGPTDAMFIVSRGLDLILDWTAMPVLLAIFARRLGIARSYASYIVVRNWASVIMAAPQAGVALLAGLGLIPIEFAAVVSLAIVGVMLRYHYQIVGATLGKSVGFRVGLVAADLALSLVLSGVFTQLFGA